MKSEVWRVSGKAPPRTLSIFGAPNRDPHHTYVDGTLRWQAPELMAGSKSKFLASMDIYAFAICCVEILNKGNLPWQLLDDDAVRRIVLSALIPTSLRILLTTCPSQRTTEGQTSQAVTRGRKMSLNLLDNVGSYSLLLALNFLKWLMSSKPLGRSTMYPCNTYPRMSR